MLADLVAGGARVLAFVRSRHGAEQTALSAQRRLAEIAPELSTGWPPTAAATCPRSGANWRRR